MIPVLFSRSEFPQILLLQTPLSEYGRYSNKTANNIIKFKANPIKSQCFQSIQMTSGHCSGHVTGFGVSHYRYTDLRVVHIVRVQISCSMTDFVR